MSVVSDISWMEVTQMDISTTDLTYGTASYTFSTGGSTNITSVHPVVVANAYPNNTN